MLKNIDENILLFSARFLKQKEYWISRLSGDSEETSLRLGSETAAGNREVFDYSFSPHLSKKLVSLGKESNLSIYIILSAGIKALIHRYTGVEDLRVLSPVHRVKVTPETLNHQVIISSRAQKGMTFKELILQVRQAVLEAYANQDYPYDKLIQSMVSASQIEDKRLSGVACLLRNIHDDDMIQRLDNQLVFSFNRSGDNIDLRFSCFPGEYDEEYLKNIALHLSRLLEAAIQDLDSPIERISFLSPQEEQLLLKDYNAAAVSYQGVRTLHGLIEEQVDKTPENIAITGPDGSSRLSYRELERKSNRLARELSRKGVGAGTIVGIMVRMSPELLVGILAILKAGGAYLPISPDYPGDRVTYMIEDSNIRHLICDKKPVLSLPRDFQFMDITEPALFSDDDSRPGLVVDPASPAYVIYTSGTTGRPKGVLVRHRDVVNTLVSRRDIYQMDHSHAALQLFSYSFDGFVTSAFTPLISGSRLVVLDEDEIKDIEVIQQSIRGNRVTHFISVPPLYRAIIEHLSAADAASLEVVTLAGDRIPARLLEITRDKNPRLEIVNEYGVTEGSVMSTIFRHQEKAGAIKIGRPIDNTRVYVVDKYLQLLPPGVPGELCIAGAGVAVGYLNNPRLSHERFVPDPFKEGEKMYRTGDKVRWLGDGNLEILGRMDFQVKIRGFRIELKEIENRLGLHPAVKECLVVAGKGSQGTDKYLCAYVVTGEDISTGLLREFLSRQLPDYMVPAYFIKLDAFPLTPGGKLNRAALPEPRESEQQNEAYVAPTNPVEEKLAAIWQNVLGREKIGVNENFFMIGGDSIKSIQIASRMTMEGYRVEMKDLFQHPTIAKLAPRVKKIRRVSSQEPVTGNVPLTPIQAAFFHDFEEHAHHNNQAVMLYSREPLDSNAIGAVFQKIQEHHDVLRMVYSRSQDGVVIQENRGLDYPLSFEEFDLKSVKNAVRELESITARIQASINLENGPIMKLGLFRLEDGDRLLIVVHHLVIDTVSWRILFEDIERLYRRYLGGETLKLPAKSDSFRDWAVKLSGYADSDTFLKEKQFWRWQETVAVPVLEADTPGGSNRVGDTLRHSFRLSGEETQQLLTKANFAFGTEINDILLTALGIAFKKTFGHDRLMIALEGHGREEILEDVDINRTVGWFTSVYPVVVDFSRELLARQVKEVKETLRRVPNKGIGYGILKYITSPGNKEDITFKLSPAVSFNYLGQFDQDIPKTTFGIASESAGPDVSHEEIRQYELDISGMLANKQLVMSIDYSGKRFHRDTIGRLAEAFKSALHEVITFCSSREHQELTPSDLTYTGLSIEELEKLCSQFPVEDLYRLSPMQEGMLFHALYEEESSAYFVRISYRLKGHLDLKQVEDSLNELFRRHQVLRTVFVHTGVERPLQVVLKNREVDFNFQDIRPEVGRSEEQKLKYIQDFKDNDMARSFDLSRDVLMRVSVLQTGTDEYEFIWSQHHILMDGWCTGILISEFFEIYNSFLKGETYRLPEVKPYRTYIQWLQEQDPDIARQYWSRYLEGYEEQATLPLKQGSQSREKTYRKAQFTFQLDPEETGRLNRLAAMNQVTLNTVIQSLWGVLSGNYNRKRDIVFGAVVSGRPPEIEGMELMVGLFINTIPVRISYSGDTTFKELLATVQSDAVAAESYHYFSLSAIQALTPLKQDLFDNIIVFENYPITERIDGIMAGENEVQPEESLDVSDTDVFEQTTYDFYLVVLPKDRLTIVLNYNSEAILPEAIERVGRHLKSLLRQVIANQDIGIDRLELLGGDELRRILYDLNDTEAGYPHDSTLHGLFEQQTGKTPGAIALVDGSHNGDEAPVLSYRDLNHSCDRLARILRNRGVETGDVVALVMRKSIDMIVGMLGILKAGAAYMPIDPEYPAERVEYMLRDSNAVALLAERSCDVIEEIHSPIDVIFPAEIDTDVDTPLPQVTPRDLAYIIYTSGTTGRPKGVMIEHRNVVRLMKNDRNLFDFRETDVWTMFHSYNFDFSVWEMYGALLFGGKLILVSREIARDPYHYLQILRYYNVTVLNQTPSAFYNLSEAELIQPEADLSLRYVIFGGEALNPGKLDKWKARYPRTKLINMFGITETTVHVTYKEIGDEEIRDNISNIGCPIPTLTCYVMDDNMKLLPVGVPGECCVGGLGVGRGYLDRPGLTADRFKDNPYKPGERLYRSGDLVRFLENGELEYLGRIDHQVKIRGFRIELGEIESRLLLHDEIKEAVVIDGTHQDGSRYLCAYIVPSSFQQNTLTVSHLREFLSQSMPDYMIPAYFVQIQEVPLTVNGKLDRKALPSPEVEAVETDISPRNPTEETLVQIWSEALGVENMGITSSYFELGGDSIKAIGLLNRVNKTFNAKLKLVDIFTNDTVEKLASILDSSGDGDIQAVSGEDQLMEEVASEIEALKNRILSQNDIPGSNEIDDIYPMSDIEKGMVFHSLKESSVAVYHDQMVRQVRYPDFSPQRFEKALELMVEKHPILRTAFNMEDFEDSVQIVYKKIEADFFHRDLSHLGRTEQEAHIRDLLAEDRKNPFVIDAAPLWRCRTFTLGNGNIVVLWICHHAIIDGWSDASLMTELNNTYLKLNSDPGFVPVKLINTYKEFIIDQLAEKRRTTTIEFWRNELSGYKRLEYFSAIKKENRVNLSRRYNMDLGIPLLEKLKQVARKNHTSVKHLCFAAHIIMLNMLSSGNDMVVGLISNSRPLCEDGDKMLGCFLNTVPVRIKVPGSGTAGWGDYIRMVEEKLKNLKAFERLPLFEIARVIGEETSQRNPILDTTFNYVDFHIYREAMVDHTDESQQSAAGLALQGYINTNALFDFNIETTFDHFSSFIYYDNSVVCDEMACNMMNYFRRVLDKFIDCADEPLDKTLLMGDPEKQQLLVDFNKTDVSHPTAGKTIRDIFENQVEQTPGHTAVVFEDRSLTYRELDQMANRVAHYLHHGRQVQVEDRVGILLHPSADFITAMLGVIKTGAAYIPIDPSLPEERLRRIIDDAGIRVLISQQEFIRKLNRLQWECPSLHAFLCLDTGNVDSVEEKEKSQRMDQKLWNYIVESSTDDITAGGWYTSYTGEPFTRKEMDEFGDNVLKKLSPLLRKDMTVLEIGCASGLTMFRVAPGVGSYYGTDLNSAIIEKNRQRVEEEKHHNIKLECLAAHEIDRLGDVSFDLIIVNSVIQSFHGHNYLRRVLKECVRMLKSDGCLFLGDILDQQLKQRLQREMIDFKIANRGKKYTTKTDFSKELFVSRAFFEDLKYDLPEISRVDFSRKIHTVENELTKFRYDAVITVNKEKKSGIPSLEKHKYQDDLGTLEGFSTEALPVPLNPENLVYTIYTSGTTGNPKGVMLQHGNLVNYVSWFGAAAGIGKEDKTVLTSSPAFDLGYTLIFSSLLNGAELHMVSRDTLLGVEQLLEYIESNRVTYLKLTPSFFTLVVNHPRFTAASFQSVRVLLQGGEAINLKDMDRVKGLCPHIRVMNHYGPTETTIGSVSNWIDFDNTVASDYRGVIGSPIDNTRVFILDKNMNPAPLGVPGELVIGGNGVCRGYLNNPELTAEKFVRNPFFPGEKKYPYFYRTGDLVRWLPNGTIDFLGRIDHQVKVRGYRIELQEIEAQLQNHFEIDDVAVLARSADGGDKYLCAYYAAFEPLEVASLRQYLSERLPDYMIPSYFVQLEKLPLNPNGKLDRSSLPDPQSGTSGASLTPPRNDMDSQLMEIWSEVLGLSSDKIGIDDDFFEMGGHSLKAITLVMKIHKELDIKMPLAEIFQASTIRELSDYIAGAEKDKFFSIDIAERKEYYELSSAQKRMYVVHQMEPGSTTYNKPMVLVLEGELERRRLTDAFLQLMQRHEILRTSFELMRDEPVQIIHEHIPFDIDYFKAPNSEASRKIIGQFVRPFDLSRAPLLRVGIIEEEDKENLHILVADMYHIVSDGVSSGLMISDFIALYNRDRLAPLRLQYKDYSEWQNQMLRSGEIRKQEAYWLDRFKGEIPHLKLPVDFNDATMENLQEGDSIPFTLDEELTSRIAQRTAETGTTSYMMLLAVFNVLLAKYTRQGDIVVGSPIAGRRHPDLEKIIGMFVNMMAMRNHPTDTKTFSQLLGEVKTTALEAFENQDYQFEELVRKLGVRDHIKAPLCNVVFVLQDMDSDNDTTIRGLQVKPYPFENKTAKFDMQLEAMNYSKFIRMELNYSRALFKRSTIDKMKKHFIEILEQVLENPGITLKDITISHELLMAKTGTVKEDQMSFGF